MKLQPAASMPQKIAKTKSSSGWFTTIILVLIIALAVLGILTAKKYFETQPTSLADVNIKEAADYVKSNPDNIPGRLALAYSYQTAERYDEAMEQYQEVLNVDAANQAAMYNMGEIERLNKKYKEAEDRLTKLLEKYEYHVLGSISLARVYIDTQRYDKAVEIMDQMIKVSPRIVDFNLVKGEALEKKGDKAKATEAFKQVLKYDPDNVDAKQAIEKLKQK